MSVNRPNDTYKNVQALEKKSIHMLEDNLVATLDIGIKPVCVPFGMHIIRRRQALQVWKFILLYLKTHAVF